MKAVFADTSFYIALISPGDDLYEAANRAARALKGLVVTTEYVLVEAANWLARSGNREAYIRLEAQIRSDPKTEIIWGGSAIYQAGFELYSRRPDKDWSLTDCISFVVMEDRGIRDALTGDGHFAQAGFDVLLK